MVAIAAMSKNRVIGNGDKLPWSPRKEDFAFFKEFTMGKQLLMGRKTFEGLPGILKGRIIWVLNKNKVEGDIDIENNQGFAYITKPHYIPQNAVVCGGASIYQQFLPKCEELYLTEFDFEAEGDVVIPAFEQLFPNKELIKEISDGKIYKYSK